MNQPSWSLKTSTNRVTYTSPSRWDVGICKRAGPGISITWNILEGFTSPSLLPGLVFPVLPRESERDIPRLPRSPSRLYHYSLLHGDRLDGTAHSFAGGANVFVLRKNPR
ncbi:hypothetical protein E2C01_050037 [Portunus trituberculatus]|uniref:Uncharacterized protein n=1 Tax=Portunus trituberculatus TaxID=210409 RepID=A0A5B7GFE4_PORTR|nr:hypothetical protein [Portunus trituberculatus]